jgi:hypothetical protein
MTALAGDDIGAVLDIGLAASVLAQLRGFAGVKAHKWLKNQPANLKGLHYRVVTEVA